MTAGSPQGTPPFQPPVPVAKRLNRNALTVAAVLMGITVLTALVVMKPGDEAGRGQGTALDAAPLPSRPSFLDAPVTSSDVVAADPSPTSDVEHVRGDPPMLSGAASERAAMQFGSGPVYGAHTVPPPSLPSGSGRNAAFRTALGSSLLVPEVELPSATLTPDAVAALPQPTPHGSSQHETREFIRSPGDRHTMARLEPAGSKYTLQAGTIIPGILLTGINSDLPGDIVGQVSRDVYDSRTLRTVLIPKSAKLIGTYDNRVVAGQGRLLVAWTRLILPDGRSMTLPGLALTDPQGQAGAKDRVDHHHDRVFGHALLLSAISAGAQLSQPQQRSVFGTPSAGQVAAGAVGQELSNVAREILQRGMDVAPTITIRQGQPFLVFLNGDIVFDEPYVEEPGG